MTCLHYNTIKNTGPRLTSSLSQSNSTRRKKLMYEMNSFWKHNIVCVDGGSRDGSLHVGGGDAGAAPTARVSPALRCHGALGRWRLLPRTPRHPFSLQSVLLVCVCYSTFVGGTCRFRSYINYWTYVSNVNLLHPPTSSDSLAVVDFTSYSPMEPFLVHEKNYCYAIIKLNWV